MGLNGIMIGALAITLGSFGLYYKTTQSKITTLTENNARLEVAIQTAEESVNLLQDTIIENERNVAQLQADLNKAEQYSTQLQATLRKHDLTMLALKKPGLIESRMNDATSKLWNDITNDTRNDGVQLVDSDSGDTDSNQD